jgi:molybdate transport system ATP-binding protein
MSNIQAQFRMQLDSFVLDAAFEAPAVGVTALFGPSGSGKTTLLRCIAGLEHVTGSLQVNGETWQDEKTFVPVHKRPLGYVFQEASLFPHLSVRANLEYGLKRTPLAERKVPLEQVVEWLGLSRLIERGDPAKLSGARDSALPSAARCSPVLASC